MIRFETVTFGYGKRPLFQGLNLSAEAGSAVGLLGLNGAGKTSLLKLAAGALFPTSGRVDVFGREPRLRSAAVLRDVYFVPEDPWVPPVTVEAWKTRYGAFRPDLDQALLDGLLEEFAVERTKSLAKLSYGQRKKFAIAAALSCGARAVLLDEPTTGLDIPSKTQFRRALANASGSERIIVVSTHQARDLENLLDPLIIVHQGATLATLPAADLGTKISTGRLESLEGRPVVWAEQDAFGWNAVLAEGGGGTDLELVFTAAISERERFLAALRGEALRPWQAAIASGKQRQGTESKMGGEG